MEEYFQKNQMIVFLEFWVRHEGFPSDQVFRQFPNSPAALKATSKVQSEDFSIYTFCFYFQYSGGALG